MCVASVIVGWHYRMPVLKRRQFEAVPWPPNLKADDHVFYLPITNEVFTTHEAFFQRQITLNSMVWSCERTGKSGLTYEEALESEKNAQEALETFPDNFGRPILYLVENLSLRGRLDDLVNDIYYFVKDRYFVGEEVTYMENQKKKNARVLGVSFEGEDFTDALNAENVADSPKKPSSCAKRGELRMGSPENYAYTVQIIGEGGLEDDSGVREKVSHNDLSRTRTVSSRSRLKLFLKNSCKPNGERLTVKRALIDEYGLEELSWNDVFGGPLAIFPRTPLMPRGPPKGTPRPPRKTDDGLPIPGSVEKVEKPEAGVENTPNGTLVEQQPAKKPRGRPKGSVNAQKRINASEGCVSAQKASAKMTKKKTDKAKSEKVRREIEKQQEELQTTFQQARRVGLEDVSRWEQEERLLSLDEIAELKQAIRTARERERERAREAKQREREILAEWRKQRDDVACDDLKVLPVLRALHLPDWISEDEFSDLLSIFQFFQAFSEILPVKEVRNTSRVTFSDVVRAVRSSDPRSAVFVELMHILLMAKTERGNEEDGDEVDLSNKEELPMDTNTDLDNKVHGERIRQATAFHERVRLTHGVSARHLPIDWMTMTEVLRISLMSSGYFTGPGTHRFRLFSRGAVHFFEDEGFIFANSNPDAMKTLEKKTVFDLKPSERLAIFKVLIQQLSTYNKFRALTDERIMALFDLKRELKALRNWDMNQEKEAREARLVREYEAEQIEEHGEAARVDLPERPKPSPDSVLLSNYLRMIREGLTSRRDDKSAQVKQILLTGVAYGELDEGEIAEARSMQRELVRAKEDELVNQIYDLHSSCGYYLGRDRAFRSYWFLDSVPLLLVENASCADEVGPCCGATPLDKVDEHIKADAVDDDELRVKLLGCTNSQGCPVHSMHQRPRWQYVDSNETLDKVISACNPRGVREEELAENLKYFRNPLGSLLDRSAKKMSTGELWKELMLTCDDPYASARDFDWSSEMVDMVLDFEEKVEHGGIGHLPLEDTKVTREQWRHSLKQNHSTAELFNADVKVFDECVISADSLKNISEVTKMAIAFLQVVQGVSVRFLRMPFAVNESKDKGAQNNIPTTTFQLWQKGLLACQSVSALSLFYATLEPGILWSKSRLQAKCRTCRRRGVAEKLILCVECDRCYHIDCIRPKLPRVCGEWMCSDCVAMRKAKEADEQRKRRSNGRLSQQNEEGEFSGEEGEGESSGSSSLFDDEISSADENRSGTSSVEMQRTVGGRMVRKVKYKEDSFTNGTRNLRRNAARRLADSYDSEGASSDSTQPRAKRKRFSPRREVSSRSVSLRGSDHQRRDLMRSLEAVVNDALKQPSAWPFAAPVDVKDVPDYYHIIKRPMDLRTIMNKLKQQLYDTPQQVVSDTRLIFDNCRIYNENGSEICDCADKLEEFIEERIGEIMGSGVPNGTTDGHASSR
uniref:WAC domain-containing protein n=1 Tax=Parascaris univalens TaxID=6257 RepID=A0A915BX97_PARUN